jgi:hypothetical protein
LGKAPVIRTASCGWSGVAAKQHRATVDVHTAAGILAVDARAESGVETRVGFAECSKCLFLSHFLTKSALFMTQLRGRSIDGRCIAARVRNVLTRPAGPHERRAGRGLDGECHVMQNPVSRQGSPSSARGRPLFRR